MYLKAILSMLCLLALTAGPSERDWALKDEMLQEIPSVSISLPAGSGLVPDEKVTVAGDDCARLEGQTLQLLGGPCDDNAPALWSSPPDWQVKDFAAGDLNRNGKPDLALLIWRPYKPWPIDRHIPYGGRIAAHQNADGLSCHVILVEPDEHGGYRVAWGGSALYQPLLDITATDMNGDGEQELAALESTYAAGNDVGQSLSLWEWNGFGFTLVSRAAGSFTRLRAGDLQDGTPVLITTGAP